MSATINETSGTDWKARALAAEAQVARVEALATEWEAASDDGPYDPVNPAGWAADIREALEETGTGDIAGIYKADALREAAEALYLARPGQHHEHTKTWLHRRANLIDPRTRDTVCEHGNPKTSVCEHCTID